MSPFGRKPVHVPPTARTAPPAPAPAPTIDQAVHNTAMRQGHLEARLKKVEDDIENLKRELQRCRPGTSQHNMYKRRILAAMRERKRIDNQVGSSFAMQSNFQAIQDASFTLDEAAQHQRMLEQQNRMMQQQQQKVNVDAIQDAQDDMREHIAETQEIQEILGEEYGVDGIDDAELEAELDGLGEELGYGQATASATPSYLQPTGATATPSYLSEPSTAGQKNPAQPNPTFPH